MIAVHRPLTLRSRVFLVIFKLKTKREFSI